MLNRHKLISNEMTGPLRRRWTNPQQ